MKTPLVYSLDPGHSNGVIVNPNESDIAILSSDDVVFGLHEVNMKINMATKT
jgi:hypothetical protein